MKQNFLSKYGPAILLTVMLLCPLAMTYAQTDAASKAYDVNLSLNQATVRSFTEAFAKETGVLFSYDSAIASKNLGDVAVKASKLPLTAILDSVFAGKAGFSYEIVSSTVVVSYVESQGPSGSKLSVTGTVTDVMGDPLIGAGVFVKGTANGVTTDAMGRYAIKADSDAVLVFSYIGFKDGEKPVNNRSVIDITLVEDLNILDDVVVVGYGTQSRKTLTTSISKVDGEKLYGQPVSTVGDALKGKVSGLRVASNSTLAGASPRFLIRGGSSINMGNDPIYIVDGALRDDLQGINPNDIESMEVLKDAASAAIYGARASNGVILVTTKKGNISRGPEIVFDAQVGFSAPERKWDFMSARELLAWTRPAIANIYANSSGTLAPKTWLEGQCAWGTGNTTNASQYTTQYLERGGVVPEGYQWMIDPLDPSKVLIFTDTDFQSQWMSEALWHKEYIGINGGNVRLRYAASISYLGDEGVYAMTGYDVITTHANVSFKITKNLEAATNFDLSRQRTDRFVDNYFNAFGRGIMFAPTSKGFHPEVGYITGTGNKNAQLAEVYEKYCDREAATNRTSSSFSLKWTIIEGLSAFAQYTFYDNQYRGSYYTYGEIDGYKNPVTSERSTTETRTQTSRNTFTAHLSYDKTFNNKHDFSAVAGWELLTQRYWYLTANSTGSVSDDVPIIQSGVNFSASNKDERQAMMSAFARVQYDYEDRYILSATFRADGSSKFAKGNRWGYFPAGSAAWVISEEPFFANAKNKMNTLKIRASYGLTGNNGIGLYDTYGAFATDVYHGTSTLLPSKMQNTGMKWETTTQLDLGVDFGFLRDRVRFIFDYYNKKTDNMLFSIKLPDTAPYSSVKANIGSARFYGFEAEVNADVIARKNFTWSVGATYSYNQNKVLSLPEEYAYEEVDTYGNLTGKIAYRIDGYKMSETGYRFAGIAVGEPLGRIYGYKIDHIIESDFEAAASMYDSRSKGHRVNDGQQITGRKDVGDYAFVNRVGSAKDVNGNEIINDEDQFYLGSAVPHSIGGISNTFRYKRLSLHVYFDYALGHSIYNYMKTRMIQHTMGMSQSALASYAKDCWKYPGDPDAKYARYFPNDADYGNANWGRASDFNVENASYLCLRDVSLYYDLPDRWVNKIGMKKLTVGVSGNTLHYFTGVTGAINPETGMAADADAGHYSVTNNANSNGNIFPATSKFLLNVKITF